MLFLQKDEMETSIWRMICKTEMEVIFYYFMWYLLSKYLIYEFFLESVPGKKIFPFTKSKRTHNLSGFLVILAAGKLRFKFCM